jgi:uncharacterized protein YpbB
VRFKQGKSLQQIAMDLNVSEGTVTKYLVECILDGTIVDVSPWVSEQELQEVLAAADKVGYGRLIPIREACGEHISFEKIKIALAFRPVCV